MKNRWISMLLCVGLTVMGLAGCGSAGKDAESAAEGQDAGAGEDTESERDSEELEDADGDSAAAQEGSADGSGEDASEEEQLLAQGIQLEGMSLSILGDSISTFDGWIPGECTVFYPRDGEVTDVSETWWMQLIEETGMELCANNSSAGSTCTGDSLCAEDPSYGCSGGRISLLMGKQGKMPDIIVVYMGINDLLKGVPLGENDGTQLVEEGVVDNFSDAYCLILDKLASDYPISQVYCCSLTPVGEWGTDQPFVVFKNHRGFTAEDYSERIRIIAQNKGVSVIELNDCGIGIDNLQEMTSDGVHLTPAGMACVKEAVLGGLQGVY